MERGLNRCKKINKCAKIDCILDKDMLEIQYVDAIRLVCSKCKEKEV
jgi:hypothetical protein